MKFEDHFSNQSELYAHSRPQYPDELFTFLASLVNEHKLAWDCATGNGQAAIMLAANFDHVIATDASEKQIINAKPHPHVEYRIAAAEDPGLEDSSVDIVTIATALHWFDLDKFYAEVRRIVKPGGVIAAWGYFKVEAETEVAALVARLTKEILGPYWPEGAKKLMHRYTELPFPFEKISAPDFRIDLAWNMQNLIDYIESWSSSQNFIREKGHSPIEEIRRELESVWGNPETRKMIHLPLVLLLGRVI